MGSVWDYFTYEQQEKLKKKIEQVREQIGPEELKRLGKESNDLISKLHVGLAMGIPPNDPEVVSLAKHLAEKQAVVDVIDPEIDQAVERFHVENPDQKDHGMDLNLYRYIEKAKSY